MCKHTMPDITSCLSWSTWVFLILISLPIFSVIFRCVIYRSKSLPPGPNPLEVLKWFASGITGYSLYTHRNKYGDISCISLLGKNIVFLNSADTIGNVFSTKDFDYRPNSFFKRYVETSDMVFSSPNEPHWKTLWHFMHSSLKTYGSNLERMENIVVSEISYLEEVWEKYDDSVDIQEDITKSVCNIMLILLIGTRFTYDDRRLVMVNKYNENGTKVLTIGNSFLLNLLPWIQYMPFGLGKLIQNIKQYRQDTLNAIWEEINQSPKSEMIQRDALVFKLIEKVRINPNILCFENINGTILDILGGGITTTTNMLHYFILLMLHYPSIQRRIQQEIDEIIGHTRRPMVDDRFNMHYTQAAILELVRYTTIAPFTGPHTCIRSIKIGDFVLPKDTIVVANLFGVNHDDSVWEKPWNFIPERFLDTNGKLIESTHSTRKALNGFGTGGRICVGELFAKTRIFLFITFLLQKFQFSPSSKLPSCDIRDSIAELFICAPYYDVLITKRTRHKSGL